MNWDNRCMQEVKKKCVKSRRRHLSSDTHTHTIGHRRIAELQRRRDATRDRRLPDMEGWNMPRKLPINGRSFSRTRFSATKSMKASRNLTFIDERHAHRCGLCGVEGHTKNSLAHSAASSFFSFPLSCSSSQKPAPIDCHLESKLPRHHSHLIGPGNAL